MRNLLLILFAATIGSSLLGLDLGVAPGISIKNVMLYAAASVIAVQSAVMRNRKVELLPVILPFALLIFYALMTWVFIIVFLHNPYYSPTQTLIRLKVKLVDQILMLLVFFYGVANWKDALWVLKGLTWIVIFGCLITVIDTYDIPNLGIIGARDVDGRINGYLGSSQEFGALTAFFVPTCVALWWTETGTKKLMALAGIALMLVCIMLSGSRGAMLGLVAGGIIAVVYMKDIISTQMVMRMAMVALLITAVSALLVLSTGFGAMFESRLTVGIGTGDVESLSSGRTAIWGAAWHEMAEYPMSFVTGLGWESYYQTIGRRYATHSVYLDQLYNLGIIGLGLLIFTFAKAVAILRGAISSVTEQAAPFLIATVTGMTAFMIAMTFSDIYGSAIYVWAFMGLALRIAVSNPGQASDRTASQRDGRLRTRDHT